MNFVATIDRPVDLFQSPYRLTINGRRVEAKARFDVLNPATGKLLAHAPSATTQSSTTPSAQRSTHSKAGRR